MGELLTFLKSKKNLANILILGILVLAIPVGINLVKTQQIIKSRAAADPIVFTGANVKQRSDGTWTALKPQISLQITSPLGPPPAPTRQSLCFSETLSGDTLSSSQNITITSTAKVSVTKFIYAFYNLDNLYSANNPKPIRFTANTDYTVLESISPAAATHSTTINFAQFNKPDTNWSNQIPTHIQVNAYFIDNNGMTSLADVKCVQSFNVK